MVVFLFVFSILMKVNFRMSKIVPCVGGIQVRTKLCLYPGEMGTSDGGTQSLSESIGEPWSVLDR